MTVLQRLKAIEHKAVLIEAAARGGRGLAVDCPGMFEEAVAAEMEGVVREAGLIARALTRANLTGMAALDDEQGGGR